MVWSIAAEGAIAKYVGRSSPLDGRDGAHPMQAQKWRNRSEVPFMPAQQ
jgi:hypothetical protein